jgi:hypothetical protein
MKLYINGDSHSAAAEAVVPHAFAEDDGALRHLGRAPHPANAAVSWGRVLADTVKATLYLDAESASSNQRIRRTTQAWLESHRPWLAETVMLIQWSTWEREEWLIDGVYYQVTASGTDDVPVNSADRYRKWVADMNWDTVLQREHDEIWQLHNELQELGVRHVFFNGNSTFDRMPTPDRFNWGQHYIDPYNASMSYDQWLKNNKFSTVSPDSWHFGADGHVAWARFMLQYGMKHNLWK